MAEIRDYLRQGMEREMSFEICRIRTFLVSTTMISAGALCIQQIAAADPVKKTQNAQYDAALGTLPSKQGFGLINSDPGHLPAIVKENVLEQGPTSLKGTQYWRTNKIPLDFSPSGLGISAEWVVRIDESTSYPSPHFRTGWHVGIRDNQERLILVFLGTDRVALVNGDPDNKPAVTRFDASKDFHHYRLIVDDELAILFVDGRKKPLLTRPIGEPEPGGNQANLVYFGDGTQLAGGKSRLKHFYYANHSAAKSQFHP